MATSSKIRLLFALGAALCAVALALNLALAWRIGQVNWPQVINMLGLMVLTATGAIDVPQGRIRIALTVLALLLILPPSAAILTAYGRH